MIDYSPTKIIGAKLCGRLLYLNLVTTLRAYQLKNLWYVRASAAPTETDSWPACPDLCKAIPPIIELIPSSEDLLDLLRTQITQPEMPEEGFFIRVMSLHKSKGLTARVVIVADCIEGAYTHT